VIQIRENFHQGIVVQFKHVRFPFCWAFGHPAALSTKDFLITLLSKYLNVYYYLFILW
jgi:hypothetical protein